MDKDFVEGVLIRVSWADINPASGVYGWTLIDEQLDLLEEAGKTGTLAVINGTLYPSWLEDDIAFEAFDFARRNGETARIPIPWNAPYLMAWCDFISELGARYDNHPILRLIRITHSGSNGMEFQLPQTPTDVQNWIAAGYTHERHLQSWQTVIDCFESAFKVLPLDLDFHPVAISQSSEGLSDDKMAEDVYTYASTVIGPRFGALAAWWSRPNADAVYTGQFDLMNQSSESSFATVQVVGSFTDHWSDRFKADSPLAAAADTIQFTVDEQDLKYLEIWNIDMEEPDADFIDLYESILPDVLPPEAPSNLQAYGSSSQVVLTWEAPVEPAQFNIYSAPVGGTYIRIASGLSGTEYTDSSSIPGSRYAVTSVGANKVESWFSNAAVPSEIQRGGYWILY